MKSLDDFIVKSKKKPWRAEGVEWREVRLGDKNYFYIETGATPETSVKEYWENGIIKWATPKDLGKNNGKYLFDTDRKITEAGLNSCSTTLIPKGSILISTRAPIGHIALLGDEMCFNQGCKGIIIKTNQILSEFIYYVLLTKVELMKILGSGPTFEELSKNKLGTVEIPLPFRNGKPDLETQKKIVEYIETNFSRIDKILEKKKKQLEQLDELWESVLEQAFKPKKREEWREVKLTEAVEILDKYRIPVKKEDRKSGPYPYCGANGIIDFVDGYTHDGEFLLLAEDGGFFGKGELTAYIMKGKFWANNHVHVLKAKPNISLRYLYYFSIFYDFTPHLRGATRPKLSQTGMKRIKIPIPFHNNLPDIEKQKEIANYLDSVYEKIKVLKEKIQNQITQLEEMKESILDEVFNHKAK